MKPSPEISQLLETRIQQALLQEWDPIGIREFTEAHDEYDAYVPDIVRMLSSRASEEEVLAFLWWLETEHMGLRGSRERTERFAKRLCQIGEDVIGPG